MLLQIFVMRNKEASAVHLILVANFFLRSSAIPYQSTRWWLFISDRVWFSPQIQWDPKQNLGRAYLLHLKCMLIQTCIKATLNFGSAFSPKATYVFKHRWGVHLEQVFGLMQYHSWWQLQPTQIYDMRYSKASRYYGSDFEECTNGPTPSQNEDYQQSKIKLIIIIIGRIIGQVASIRERIIGRKKRICPYNENMETH